MLSKFESTGSSRSPINACGPKKGICHARILSLIEEFGAWENFSTAFIHDGLFRSASAEHFTAGHYELEDEDEGFEMEGNLTQYIEQRPLFGRNEVKGLPIKFSGRVFDGVTDGEASVVDDSKHSLRLRLNRLPYFSPR